MPHIAFPTDLPGVSSAMALRSENYGPERAHSCTKDVRHGALQTKFAASFVLPVPLYVATCGYGHNGRLMSTR